MAIMQWNALSTCLFGSFEAVTLLPDAALLTGEAGQRYPVLYLLHDNGENPMQFLRMPELEKLCNARQLIICCPWISHSLGHDLRWGGKFGRFAGEEFPGICQHMFPVDNDRAMIGGIGWGAYAACAVALRSPGRFRKIIAFNGCFDLAALGRKLAAGEEDPFLSAPMLQAVAGELTSLAGSEKDLFAHDRPQDEIWLGCGDEAHAQDSRRLAEAWGASLYTGSLAQIIAEAMAG
ncbi:MAG: hypothetical protein IJ662_09055 [Clostridia bacterium]|nr:hypothetical protein [Clostridia bacterium]